MTRTKVLGRPKLYAGEVKVQLTAAQRAALDKAAAREGVSRSDVIREALDAKLEEVQE